MSCQSLPPPPFIPLLRLFSLPSRPPTSTWPSTQMSSPRSTLPGHSSSASTVQGISSMRTLVYSHSACYLHVISIPLLQNSNVEQLFSMLKKDNRKEQMVYYQVRFFPLRYCYHSLTSLFAVGNWHLHHAFSGQSRRFLDRQDT